jgi:hypothetical protein
MWYKCEWLRNEQSVWNFIFQSDPLLLNEKPLLNVLKSHPLIKWTFKASCFKKTLENTEINFEVKSEVQ